MKVGNTPHKNHFNRTIGGHNETILKTNPRCDNNAETFYSRFYANATMHCAHTQFPRASIIRDQNRNKFIMFTVCDAWLGFCCLLFCVRSEYGFWMWARECRLSQFIRFIFWLNVDTDSSTIDFCTKATANMKCLWNDRRSLLWLHSYVPWNCVYFYKFQFEIRRSPNAIFRLRFLCLRRMRWNV